MSKLAVDGGTPVFQQVELDKYIPAWPVPHPETDQKLLDIFHSSNWGGGEYEEKLGKEFAAFQNAKYSVWMCNGTTTLECALLALGIGPGDEVIVPGVTWIATAEAPIYVGAKPVIVDIDPETLCIDPVKIEEAISPRTKAIIPVHLYSALADMDRINDIAKKHGLYVIEDCAHAHGTKQHGKGTGSLSDIGSFSFQLSKLMTGGEGGCCTTSDEELADKLFRLCHIGSSKTYPQIMPEPGMICHQYRFTGFQAAIIYDQLQHQAEYRAKRQAGAAILRDMVKDINSLEMQRSSFEDDLRDYYFLTFLLHPEYLKEGVDRVTICTALKAEGIFLGTGWGNPLYKSRVWNVPQELYVKHNTDVCEDVMFKRLMCTQHSLLLAEATVLERWGEALRKVMLAYTK